MKAEEIWTAEKIFHSNQIVGEANKKSYDGQCVSLSFYVFYPKDTHAWSDWVTLIKLNYWNSSHRESSKKPNKSQGFTFFFNDFSLAI